MYQPIAIFAAFIRRSLEMGDGVVSAVNEYNLYHYYYYRRVVEE